MKSVFKITLSLTIDNESWFEEYEKIVADDAEQAFCAYRSKLLNEPVVCPPDGDEPEEVFRYLDAKLVSIEVLVKDVLIMDK